MARIIGIDLGTTNTCAAFVSNKIPRVIPTESGYNTMPSVVTYHPSGSVFVGQNALEYLVTQPEYTVTEVKRLMGRQASSRTVQELARRLRYKIVAGANNEAAVSIAGKEHTPTEVQAKILAQLRRYTEIHLGEDVEDAVIAVPAYYSDHQRQLVKDAGKLAGWNVHRVVNEPTAAALAYGFNRGFDQKILVYDFGGGTFDVSILCIRGNLFEVMATGGDLFLGGADFDERIMAWMVEEFRKATKIDLLEEPAAMQRLRQAAERAKIELSLLVNTQVRIPELLERKGRHLDLELLLDRDTLNTLCKDLVQRSIGVIERLLGERQLDKHDIDEVILVGGQTRMPLVVDTITQYFGKGPRKGVHPDECVALGAALLGDSLARAESVTLADALAVPIGISVADGSLKITLDKHKPLPQSSSVEIATASEGQTSLRVDLYQGEPGPASAAEYIGTATFPGLPPGPAGAETVRFVFAMSPEGMLSVTGTRLPAHPPVRLPLTRDPRNVVLEEKVDATHVQEPDPVPAPGLPQRGGIAGLVKSLWGAKK